MKRMAIAVVCGFLGLVSGTWAGEIKVKDGAKVAFMGDSITASGYFEPSGYVRLIMAGLEANGIKIQAIPAGVRGHKSNDMLGRLKAVLDQKPDWMTLSCGVNDVGHGEKGVPLEAYKTNITAIVDKCQAAGVKVMILTATMITEDPANANNIKLAAYNDFLRTLAVEKKCPLADLNADMQALVAGKDHQRYLLTADGVHMNPSGSKMMAKGILKAFGLDDVAMAKVEASWYELPTQAMRTVVLISARQHDKLMERAKAANASVDDLLSQTATTAVRSLLDK